MWPGRLPRDPKIAKNRSGSVGKPSRALGGKTHFAHHGFLGGPGHQQSHFEVPAGTLKSSKNRSLAKKGVPGSVILSIFLASSVFLTSGLDFSSIFGEKSMKKSMHFLKAARVFFNLATP